MKTNTENLNCRHFAALLFLWQNWLVPVPRAWKRFARGSSLRTLFAAVSSIRLWYWTSMLWSIDTCQNKVSADQYHVTISRAQIRTYRGQLFFKVDRWPRTGCWLDRRLKPGQTLKLTPERGLIFRALSVARRGYTAMLRQQSSWQSMLFVFRYGLENIFFLHFSLVSIQV